MSDGRYARQIVLPNFGKAGQKKLQEASVLVVGAGGLGVPVMQYLTGMGVGKLTIIDNDTVALHNLARQVIYTTEEVGNKKVVVAKKRLYRLNPEVNVEVREDFLSQKNAEEIISAHQIVVDCSDNIPTRYWIDEACAKLQIPFVYGALFRYEGQVSVFHFEKGIGYRDLFPPSENEVQNCSEAGVMGVLPGIVGCYQAMEVVKIITGIGTVLSGLLLLIDTLNNSHDIFELKKTPLSTTPSLKADLKYREITWKELATMKAESLTLLDVQTTTGYEEFHVPGFANLPLETLTKSHLLPKINGSVVLTCRQGISSVEAAIRLHTHCPELSIYVLKGGYLTYEP